MKTQLLLFAALFQFTAAFVFAQEDARKVKLDTRRTLRLDYKSDAWNKDPRKVETNILLIRDAGSGRLAKIEVTETGPDTSLFIGFYHINFENGDHAPTEITAEIYVAPPEILSKPDAFKNVDQLIKDGTLLRKPYFLRVEGGSVQAISVYDSKEQAFQAYEDFLKSGSGRPIVDRAALEAQKLSQMAEAQRKLKEAQLKAEAERARIEDDEKAKQAERVRKQSLLDAAEKARRIARAKELAEEAMAFYRQDKMAEAEDRFQKSTELDPGNQGYFFQYGVTLYKREKYNKSLVILDLAKGPDVNISEKTYYQALDHMKLKEYDSAYREFLEVKGQGNKLLASTSGFFAGVIDYQKENYDSAKGLFEYVIDNSDDPKVDQQAETFLEQISNIKQFQDLQKKKIIMTANMGVLYDSNILSQATNLATNSAGVRASYGGSIEYRPIYNQKHELSALLSVSDLYSVDTNLQPAPTLQNSDPLVLDVKMPYKFKGEFLGKPYQIGLTPYFESLQMNADGIGNRETIENSTAVAIDQTFVMSENWFANYLIDLRRDVYLLSTAATENQTANKYMLYTTQTFYQDSKKSSAFSVELGYTMNNALGDNQIYNKIDLAGNYFRPVWKDLVWTARLAAYNSKYPNHSLGRVDNDFGLTTGIRTALSEILSLSFSLGYSKNASNVDSFSYDKYTVGTSLSWNQSF